MRLFSSVFSSFQQGDIDFLFLVVTLNRVWLRAALISVEFLTFLESTIRALYSTVQLRSTIPGVIYSIPSAVSFDFVNISTNTNLFAKQFYSLHVNQVGGFGT